MIYVYRINGTEIELIDSYDASRGDSQKLEAQSLINRDYLYDALPSERYLAIGANGKVLGCWRVEATKRLVSV